jgi:hypothetical protein
VHPALPGQQQSPLPAGLPGQQHLGVHDRLHPRRLRGVASGPGPTPLCRRHNAKPGVALGPRGRCSPRRPAACRPADPGQASSQLAAWLRS